MFQKLLLTYEHHDKKRKELVKVFTLIDDSFQKEVFMRINARLSFPDFRNAYNNLLYDIYYLYKASSQPVCKNMELVIGIFGHDLGIENTIFYKRIMRKF